MNRRQFLTALSTMAAATIAAPYVPTTTAIDWGVDPAYAVDLIRYRGVPMTVIEDCSEGLVWFLSPAHVDYYNTLVKSDRRYRLAL